MNDTIILTCSIISFCAIIIFAIGLYLGSILTTTNNSSYNQYLYPNKTKSIVPKIDIDDKKIVLDIKTDSLVKKFDTITEEKIVSTNINTSIDKLKNIKR